jgi:hypothetical protein
MPLPLGFGVASGTGTCALAQTIISKTQTRTAMNRQMLFADDIDR